MGVPVHAGADDPREVARAADRGAGAAANRVRSRSSAVTCITRLPFVLALTETIASGAAARSGWCGNRYRGGSIVRLRRVLIGAGMAAAVTGLASVADFVAPASGSSPSPWQRYHAQPAPGAEIPPARHMAVPRDRYG